MLNSLRNTRYRLGWRRSCSVSRREASRSGIGPASSRRVGRGGRQRPGPRVATSTPQLRQISAVAPIWIRRVAVDLGLMNQRWKPPVARGLVADARAPGLGLTSRDGGGADTASPNFRGSTGFERGGDSLRSIGIDEAGLCGCSTRRSCATKIVTAVTSPGPACPTSWARNCRLSHGAPHGQALLVDAATLETRPDRTSS